MKIQSILKLAILVAGMAVFAAANPVSVTFVSGGPYVPGGTSGNISYYPYTISVNGHNVTVACDDFFDEVSAGETWQANVNTFANLTGTAFYNLIANPVQTYQEAAWLFTNFQSSPNNNVTAAINYAIWDLFYPNSANSSTPPTIGGSALNGNTSSAYWLQQASNEASVNFPGIDFSNFLIYTPIAGTQPQGFGTPQEYIGEVPEPATLALLGTGLLGLAFLFRRRLYTADGRKLQS